MEFTQYKCPVCEKRFESGDDVVVCPECGAPHHRECYEKEGKCFFDDKHSEDFSFEELEADTDESADEENVCPVCGHNNAPGVLFCSNCGSQINKSQPNNQYRNTQQQAQYYQGNQNQQSTPPFGFGAAGIPNFDPLAGMNADETIADDIKVSEMAKYVGKNTNYFLMVFDRVKKFGRSKFNFCAFLFSGIYFLYRKMYALGIIFSLAVIAINVLTTYIRMTPEYNAAYQDILNYASNGVSSTSQFLQMPGKMTLLYLPELLNILRYGLMFFSGFLANRIYLNHCKKSIHKIKAQSENEDINEKLSQKGGVNLAIALSFGISTIAIILICEYIMFTAY